MLEYPFAVRAGIAERELSQSHVELGNVPEGVLKAPPSAITSPLFFGGWATLIRWTIIVIGAEENIVANHGINKKAEINPRSCVLVPEHLFEISSVNEDCCEHC